MSEAARGERSARFGKAPWNKQSEPERKLCACGCGDLARSRRNFISGHNMLGRRMSFYRGSFIGNGYVWIDARDHPYARDGYVKEHRLVVEYYLRANQPDSSYLVRLGNQLYLDPAVVVHHIDGVMNNEITNLKAMTRDEHTALHHQQGDIRK